MKELKEILEFTQQRAREWEYWARVFGYTPQEIVYTDELREWTAQHKNRKAGEQLPNPPRVSLIRDPGTGSVYSVSDLREEQCKYAPDAPLYPIPELQG